MKVTVAAVAVLAFARPADALLLIAGLLPLSYLLTTRIWGAYPANGTEALVLAFLAGWTLRSWRPAARDELARTVPRSLRSAGLAFGAVVLASAAVQVAVIQAWRDYPWRFTQAFATFLARDYLAVVTDPRPWAPWPGGLGFVASGALLIEGIALLLIVTSLTRQDRSLGLRLLRVMTVSAVGAAVLSTGEAIDRIFTSEVAMVAARSVDSAAAVWEALNADFSVHTMKVNTAGSYFVLAAFMALGGVAPWTRWSVAWAAASLTIFVGLWLTGSGAAIVAAMAIPVIAVTGFVIRRIRAAPVRRSLAILCLVAAGVIGVWFVYEPPAWLPPGAASALNFRRMFLETGLRMWAARAVFGVGTGQYLIQSRWFSSQELLANYPSSLAHNQFLQIAAELGLVGVVAFLWVLAAVVWQRRNGLWASRIHAQVAGLMAGLFAFSLTSLVGHPLITPVVAYPFWLALGLLAGGLAGPSLARSDGAAPGSGAGDDILAGRLAHLSAEHFRWWRLLTAAALLALACSVPFRVAQEKEEINWSIVTYGFYNWETEQTGRRYRWTGPRASFFVASDVRTLEIPVQAAVGPGGGPNRVDVALDGRAADAIRLADGTWHHVRLHLPPQLETRHRRVDLEINRTWTPAELMGTSDFRNLGVKVGEVRVVRPE